MTGKFSRATWGRCKQVATGTLMLYGISGLGITKEVVPTGSNQIWRTDFTYIPFGNRFYYLATIIDDFDKTILGTAIGKNHNQELVNNCLQLALSQGRPNYYHSDQGGEYQSHSHIQLLQQHNIYISMSKKSSPWENGCQESFYGKFKQELGSLKGIESEEELFRIIYDHIHYYNNCRLHTTIRDVPVKFRKKHLFSRTD